MALLLNIETAVHTASISLSNDDKLIGLAMNNDQKDHAAWLHTAIRDLVHDAGIVVTDLDAVSVSIGPGSYTGLRIGLAAAKGLCFALNRKLIAINTLEVMAHAVPKNNVELICPLIDARRMEVFTAVYDHSLNEVIKPCAMIVDKQSFSELLASQQVYFCGNGAKKLQSVISHVNATFSDDVATAAHLAELAHHYFYEKKFANLAYIEPFYIKEFYFAGR